MSCYEYMESFRSEVSNQPYMVVKRRFRYIDLVALRPLLPSLSLHLL